MNRGCRPVQETSPPLNFWAVTCFVVGFIPDRGAAPCRGLSHAAFSAATSTVFRRPENHRVVGRGNVLTRLSGPAGRRHLVDGQESQIAVGCTAQRLVFVQERAVEVFNRWPG